jgi:hypothetical protein
LYVLVTNLPPEATAPNQWSAADELAAQMVERAHELVRLSLVAIRLQVQPKDQRSIVIPDSYRVPRPGQPVEAMSNRPRLSREGVRRALLGR